MKTSSLYVAVLFSTVTSLALGDTFGSGASTFNIDFVNISNPGNSADTTGSPNPVGKVDYLYRIGKYEISKDMVDKANTLGGLGIVQDTGNPVLPAKSIDWIEAAKFVNWLNTSTSHTLAYKFIGDTFALWQPGDAGYDPNNPFRNKQAYYFLPSADEWFKAAYYDPAAGIYYDYPTGSDTAPAPVFSGTAPNTAVAGLLRGFEGPADATLAGGLSPYGTMGQGGNVREWEETEFDLVNDSVLADRGVRGRGWVGSDSISGMLSGFRSGIVPNTGGSGDIGFRVASTFVPEPSSVVLSVGILALLLTQRVRRS